MQLCQRAVHDYQNICFESRCPVCCLSYLASAAISDFELPSSLWFLSQVISNQNRNLTATEKEELSFGTATNPKRDFGTGPAQPRLGPVE
jgi:hypothetical protein